MALSKPKPSPAQNRIAFEIIEVFRASDSGRNDSTCEFQRLAALGGYFAQRLILEPGKYRGSGRLNPERSPDEIGADVTMLLLQILEIVAEDPVICSSWINLLHRKNPSFQWHFSIRDPCSMEFELEALQLLAISTLQPKLEPTCIRYRDVLDATARAAEILGNLHRLPPSLATQTSMLLLQIKSFSVSQLLEMETELRAICVNPTPS